MDKIFECLCSIFIINCKDKYGCLLVFVPASCRPRMKKGSTGAFVDTFILVNYGKTGGNPITMAKCYNFYILKSGHIKELAF